MQIIKNINRIIGIIQSSKNMIDYDKCSEILPLVLTMQESDISFDHQKIFGIITLSVEHNVRITSRKIQTKARRKV